MKIFNKNKFMTFHHQQNTCARDIKRYLLIWANYAHKKTEDETGISYKDEWCDEKEG